MVAGMRHTLEFLFRFGGSLLSSRDAEDVSGDIKWSREHKAWVASGPKSIGTRSLRPHYATVTPPLRYRYAPLAGRLKVEL